MDRDNQQEIGLISWLAGIIDGEGSIVLTISERPNRAGNTLRAQPKVVIGNTDMGIIDQVLRALDVVGVGRYQQHIRVPGGVSVCGNPKLTQSFKDCVMIEVGGFRRVHTLLTAVMPWLAGDKRQRAEVLMRFLSARLDKSVNTQRGANMQYDADDVENVLAFLRLTKSKRVDRITEILNEHTRDTPRIAA